MTGLVAVGERMMGLAVAARRTVVRWRRCERARQAWRRRASAAASCRPSSRGSASGARTSAMLS